LDEEVLLPVTRRALRLALPALAAVYLIATGLDLSRFKTPISTRLSALAFCSAILLFGAYFLIRGADTNYRRTKWTALGAALLILINAQAILLLSADLRYSVNVLLLLMGVGFILLPLHHLIGFHLLTLAAWLSAVSQIPSVRGATYLILPTVIALLIAYVCRDLVVKNEIEKERARLRDEAHYRELEEAYVALESEAEAHRKASEEADWANQILQSVSNLILVADSSAGIVYASPSVERTFGFKREDVLADGWYRLSSIDGDDPTERKKQIAAVAQSGHGQVAYEKEVRDAAGQHHWILWQNSPFLDHGLIGVGSEVTDLKKVQQERDQLIGQLQERIQQVRTLEGLLPICMHCKKIRDDGGYWNEVEKFVRDHSDAKFTHGICPECEKKHYGDF
jgi:PAS domain S-box-containing protein